MFWKLSRLAIVDHGHSRNFVDWAHWSGHVSYWTPQMCAPMELATSRPPTGRKLLKRGFGSDGGDPARFVDPTWIRGNPKTNATFATGPFDTTQLRQVLVQVITGRFCEGSRLGLWLTLVLYYTSFAMATWAMASLSITLLISILAAAAPSSAGSLVINRADRKVSSGN